MRKLFVFLAILFVSVMSSACINNFAIQELNTKAKEYLDKGDYDEAIKRLESSVDLDGEVFETRYNLAVAYVNKENFISAVKELNEAIRLNPENPDAYYTLGVALEGEGYKKVNENSENTDEDSDFDEKNGENSVFKTRDEAKYTITKLNEAIEAYKKYLETAKNPEDAEKVTEHIKELQDDVETYSKIEFAEFEASKDAENTATNKAE